MSFSLPFEPQDVIDIVRAASPKALEWRGQFNAEIKADRTLVTQADRQMEELLCTELRGLAPDFAFLGEEGGLSGSADAPCWVIDPIDGTTNFVRGVPVWCISVGLVFRGEVILGVLAVPPQNELFWAATGKGAWRERLDDNTPQTPLRLQVNDQSALMQEDLLACNTTVEEHVDFSGVPCRLRNMGSLAYHLTLLATDAVCGSLAQWHKIYDIAAGLCICREAGCEARYFDGTQWTAKVTSGTQKQTLLVAAPQTLQLLLEKLQQKTPDKEIR